MTISKKGKCTKKKYPTAQAASDALNEAVLQRGQARIAATVCKKN